MLVLTNTAAAAHNAPAPRLEHLFAEHAEFVWRLLRHLGVAPADVEDALQEVFVVVHRRLADYQERSSQRAWLYAICLRVSSKHRRSRQRRREAICGEVPDIGIEPEQEQDVERREAIRLGQRLIAALPEKQRTVFVMYELDNMSMPDIAAFVECPLQTAYARLHRARERVRADLDRHGLLLGRVGR